MLEPCESRTSEGIKYVLHSILRPEDTLPTSRLTQTPWFNRHCEIVLLSERMSRRKRGGREIRKLRCVVVLGTPQECWTSFSVHRQSRRTYLPRLKSQRHLLLRMRTRMNEKPTGQQANNCVAVWQAMEKDVAWIGPLGYHTEVTACQINTFPVNGVHRHSEICGISVTWRWDGGYEWSQRSTLRGRTGC